MRRDPSSLRSVGMTGTRVLFSALCTLLSVLYSLFSVLCTLFSVLYFENILAYPKSICTPFLCDFPA